MIKFCSIYSGSSGNCYYIEIDETRILLDVGKSAKKIIEGLNKKNIDINKVENILISHEHVDHVQGLKVISKKNDFKIYVSRNTKKEAEKSFEDISEERIEYFKTGTEFTIGNAKILSVKVSHDAVDTSMFTFKDRKGNKISVFTDLGIITDNVWEAIKYSKLAVVEANYEKNIIEVSRYPYYLKRRIMSKYGHLSNEEGAKLAKHAIENGAQIILLGHLSKENNTPTIAYQTVYNEVEKSLKDKNIEEDFILEVLEREEPGEMYIIE